MKDKGMRASIGLLLLVVIFGSGWIIYGWNKLQGRDLSKAPVYDGSEDARYSEAFAELMNTNSANIGDTNSANNANTNNTNTGDANSANTGDANGKTGFVFLADSIYLKNTFRVETAEETEKMVRDFLTDFPAIKDLVIENLEAPKVFLIELPVLNRERIMTALSRNKEVAALRAKEAPVWELELKVGKYEREVVEFLRSFKDVKLATVFPANLEYIARIDISGQKEKLAETLANLEKNYLDVVTVK
jgi:hypothetical protein